METKEKTQPKQTKQTTPIIKFRFICQKQVQFGQGIFLSGNIPQMGSWKPQNSLKMICYDINHWVLDLQIPIETQIEFKYFVSPEQTISPVYWIGNEVDQNLKLFITKQDAKQIELERKTRDLKTMSFNIRSQTQVDKNQYAWDVRKYNCVKAIRQRFPSIIGIQECSMSQRSYLEKSLQPYYKYVGFSDIKDLDQEVGIFYDKQRFILIECGFRFICETKKNVSEKTLASSCPSLFSFAVLEDTYNSERFMRTFHPSSSKSVNELPRQLFLVQNIYLSYHATKSQQQCLDMIMQETKAKREEYKDDIRDLFILGDFNLPENSHLLHSLQKSELKLESIRKNMLRRHLKEQCDLGYTFNAFEHDEHDVENPKKIIDHMYVANKDYEPMRFEVVRELMEKTKQGKPQVISDHCPIMGVFRHKRSKQPSQKMVR